VSDIARIPVSPAAVMANVKGSDPDRVAVLAAGLLEQYKPMIMARDPGEIMRLQEGLIGTLRGNPTLHEAVLGDPLGFCGAVLAALRCGLSFDPILGQAWLVPRKGKVCFQIGYKGLRELALRGGMVKTVRVGLVWPEDHFVYTAVPPVLEHTPRIWESGRTYDTCLGGYAVADLVDGTTDQLVMRREEIEKRRAVSASKAGPWSTWPEEMALKTVLAALLRRQRLRVDDVRLLNLDAVADRPDDPVPMLRSLPRPGGPSMLAAEAAAAVEQPFTVEAPPMPLDVAPADVWAAYDLAQGRDPGELAKLAPPHARNRAAKLARYIAKMSSAEGQLPKHRQLLDMAEAAAEKVNTDEVQAMLARLDVASPEELPFNALAGYVAALLRTCEAAKG